MIRQLCRSTLLALLIVAIGATGLAIPATAVLAVPTTCGGIVFHDFDHDGERTEDYSHVSADYAATDDEGVPGIEVLITAVDGTTTSATTDGTGSWSASLDTNDFPIRLDFTGLPSSWTPTPKGADSAGLTQFIADATDCGVAGTGSAGISAPGSFCENNPELVTTCFLFGNVAGHDDLAAVVSLPDGAGDNGSTSGTGWQDDPYTPIATLGQVGSVYGLDTNPYDGATFVASFVKRHTQLGPTNNPTTIYRIAENGTVAPWFTTDTGAADPHSGGTDGWLKDYDAYDDVGRSGLGDIEISPDGNTLYTVDLGQRQLVAVPINADGSANAAGVVRTTFTAAALGLTTCVDGDIRPFGLGWDEEQLLVGVTCSAESTVPANAAPVDPDNVIPLGDPSQLAAYVYSYSSGAGFGLITDVPLPLTTRGTQNGRTAPDPFAERSKSDWRPWVSEPPYAEDLVGWPATGTTYPQPLLSDIEVDGDDLVIGFMDLWGHQMGSNATYLRDGVEYDFQQPISSGDIVRAVASGGTYSFPNNGLDFTYTGDNYGGSHNETALGSSVQIPGRPYVISNAFDPINGGNTWQSGGVEWFANVDTANHSTGEHVTGYRLYDGRADLAVGTFEKAAGIGDVQALCGLAPIEVGDRVWFDSDEDGVADPDEPAMAGVVVNLLDDAGNVLASTTTDADGLYLFEADSIAGFDRGGDYEIQIAQVNYDAGGVFAPGGSEEGRGFITLTDSGADDANDNDAALDNGLPTIAFTAVSTDHTMDFGFTDTLFDLALTKVYTSDTFGAPTDGVIETGSDVTFTITVTNQGTVDAASFDVTDYMPAGFVLNDAAWTDNTDGTATITGGPLLAGASVDLSITLTADTAGEGDFVNWAEISADDGNDVDSIPDDTQGNDPQPAGPGAPTDNVTDNTDGDEDDHDPAGITVATYDLALTKVYTSDTFGAPNDGVIEVGEDVTFTIEVTNQGSIDAASFDVTDYLPTGFVLNDPAWTDNADGTATITRGPLNAGDSTDITITLTAATSSAGDVTNWAEISADDGTDIDSTPDTRPGNDAQPAGPGAPTDDVTDNSGGDEDDHDPAGVRVEAYDLALTKVYTSDTFGAPSDGLIGDGEDVTFTITVTNQGTIDATSFTVTDYLPAGFDLNDPTWTDNTDGTATITGGPLLAGASIDLPITLTAQSPTVGQNINRAEISTDDGNDTDSTPNTNPNDDTQPTAPGDPTDDVTDNTDGDEDDHDPASISVGTYDLALTKVYTSDTSTPSTDGVVETGDDVTFTITVTNQGTIDATSFEVTDYMPAGFDLNDPAWTDNTDSTATYIGGPLDAGDSTDITITLTANGAPDGAHVNWAEISVDDGPDVDSTPDDTQGNDPQPTGPGAPTDDVTDNTDGDEDDHDPAGITVASYDLALTKVYTSDTYDSPNDGIVQAGDDVTFTITVTNQGTIDATSFTVTDYMPAGFDLNDPAWTDNTDGTATITGGPLDAGDSTDITITLTAVSAVPGGSVNWAEISADDGDDVDSAPDARPGNDAQPTGPGAPTDNVTDNTDGDEDDHDPAGVEIVNYDLALTKVYTLDTHGSPNDGIVENGADVTFTITVTNQGTADAASVELTDYLPAGFTLNDAAWIDNGDNTARRVVGPISAGATLDTTITLTATGASTGDHINRAEISTDDGNDIDSNPNTNPNDDTQPTAPGDPTDDVIDNSDGDEDDHDIAGIEVELYDLALITTYSSDTFGDPTDGVIEPNTDVTWSVEVTNQGTVDAASVEITAYLPTGFVVNDPAWTDNADGTATYTGVSLLAGNSTDIEITTTGVGITSGNYVLWAEISADDGNDVDSTPDAVQSNDNQPSSPGDPTDDVIDNTDGDEDDHDPAVVGVENYDLALIKVLTDDGFGDATDGATENGRDATFTISVINQGTIDATSFEVTDYMPAGFVLNDAAWTDNADGTATYTGGPLAAGESVDIPISLTVMGAAQGTTANMAEISSDDGNDVDSTPNTDPADDTQPAAPGDPTDDTTNNDDGDEDDHDIAGITVGLFDLALTKVYTSDTSADGNASDGRLQAGDDATFTITVTNQGTLDAESYELTDYLPDDFELNDAAWTDNGDGTATINGAALAAGTSRDVTITMTATRPIIGTAVNRAEISNDSADDVDSTPDTNPGNDDQPAAPGDPTDDATDNTDGDEDDHDIAGITIDVFDLELDKDYASDTSLDGNATDGVIQTGDDVTFTITVRNTGSVDATTIEVTDYLPAGFVLNDPTWADNGDGTATKAFPATAAGGSATDTITMTAVSTGAGSLVNWAEISTDDSDDVDSTPNTDPSDDGTPPSEDDIDDAPVTVDAYDLALRKVYTSDSSLDGASTDGIIDLGDDITFTITVFNQGTVAATSMEITDHMPAGFVLNDAAWTDNGDGTAMTVVGPLGVGSSTDVTITLRAVNPSYGEVFNRAEISNDDGLDIDSTPNVDPDDDGAVTDNEIDNADNDEDDHDPAPFTVQNLRLSLGNFVWFDDDNDGLFDPEETAVVGVTLLLFDDAGNPIVGADGAQRTQVTDANGQYLFDDLVAGTYVVGVPESNFAPGGPLAGVVTSTGNDITDGVAPDPDNDLDFDDNGLFVLGDGAVSQPIVLSVGDEPDGNDNFTVDFGFTPSAGIGSQVWLDADRDGLQDTGESGVPGVTVTVIHVATGDVYGTTETNATGAWTVTGLPPGDYTVTFTDPEGRTFTTRNAGDIALDSDVAVDGTTAVYTLSAGEYDPTVDAGIVVAQAAPPLAVTGSSWTVALTLWAFGLAFLGAALILFARKPEEDEALL